MKNGVACIALLSLVSIASCAKDGDQNKIHEFADSELTLDCALGFDQLVADAIAIDGIELITETAEQRAYMTGPVSFTVTKEGHHAHPMIVRRDIMANEEEEVAIQMAACGYAAEEDFDKTVKKFSNLNREFEFQNNLDIKMSDGGVETEFSSARELRGQVSPSDNDESEISIEIKPAENSNDQPEEE